MQNDPIIQCLTHFWRPKLSGRVADNGCATHPLLLFLESFFDLRHDCFGGQVRKNALVGEIFHSNARREQAVASISPSAGFRTEEVNGTETRNPLCPFPSERAAFPPPTDRPYEERGKDCRITGGRRGRRRVRSCELFQPAAGGRLADRLSPLSIRRMGGIHFSCLLGCLTHV